MWKTRDMEVFPYFLSYVPFFFSIELKGTHDFTCIFSTFRLNLHVIKLNLYIKLHIVIFTYD